ASIICGYLSFLWFTEYKNCDVGGLRNQWFFDIAVRICTRSGSETVGLFLAAIAIGFLIGSMWLYRKAAKTKR
ncbi:MAG: hypothetical protein AAF265_14850, partial [Pseudomonadota bacterium]